MQPSMVAIVPHLTTNCRVRHVRVSVPLIAALVDNQRYYLPDDLAPACGEELRPMFRPRISHAAGAEPAIAGPVGDEMRQRRGDGQEVEAALRPPAPTPGDRDRLRPRRRGRTRSAARAGLIAARIIRPTAKRERSPCSITHDSREGQLPHGGNKQMFGAESPDPHGGQS